MAYAPQMLRDAPNPTLAVTTASLLIRSSPNAPNHRLINSEADPALENVDVSPAQPRNLR